MTSPQNERFAQVLVNRLWKRYLGWGLVEPVDDWNEAEVSHPELLEFLAAELATHDYDVKHVARLILNSKAYQREATQAGSEWAEADERLFAAAARRRLTAEQLVDSLCAASGKQLACEELNLDPEGRRPVEEFLNLGVPTRAWQMASLSNERDRPALSLPRAQSVVDVMDAFNWRESRQNPISEREDALNPLQPLTLANGVLGNRMTRLSDDSALTALCLEDQPLDVLIRETFLCVLSRPPSVEELQAYQELLQPGYTGRVLSETTSAETKHANRTNAVSWSNHLSPEASRIKLELEREAREGDPPTPRLATDWRERMEDMLWALVNSPEFVFVP